MVTKEELYKHPKVVERILEEVEKQRCEKIKDLEGIRLYLAFTWKASIEGEEIWREIHSNSNFTPFYEFWKIQDPTVEAVKTQIDPNDLKEGDIIFNPFYTDKPIVITKGTNGDLYGIDSTSKKAFQVSLNHFGNSFTPYNIVNGGATFERPLQYPKNGELCYCKDESEHEIIDWQPIYFKNNGFDNTDFKNGRIITAEAYFKLINEYNSKL